MYTLNSAGKNLKKPHLLKKASGKSSLSFEKVIRKQDPGLDTRQSKHFFVPKIVNQV